MGDPITSGTVKELVHSYSYEQLLKGKPSMAGPFEDHLWSPEECSDNMIVLEGGSVVQRKSGGPPRTDCVRVKASYTSDFHEWEITWPRDQRGKHAVIGVATKQAPLTCEGYTPLLGANDQSFGWNIKTNEILHNDCVIRKYPDEDPKSDEVFRAPETISLVLNMDQGTVSFKANGVDLGVAFTGLEKLPSGLSPAVSAVYGGCRIRIQYVLDKKQITDVDGECPYRVICTRFKESLHISNDYFNPEFDLCYCENCHTLRGDDDYYIRGNPPKDYGIPKGWCRFALK